MYRLLSLSGLSCQSSIAFRLLGFGTWGCIELSEILLVFQYPRIRTTACYNLTMEGIELAITFDDILFIPARFSVLPKDAGLTIRIAKNIFPEHSVAVHCDGYRSARLICIFLAKKNRIMLLGRSEGQSTRLEQ